jgi:hypothetical protein
MSSITSSNPLVLTPIEGEPRVHDLDLAERLGFDQPRDIRKLIKRNEAKLLKFGVCATVARCIEIGNGAKREVEEFYLNKKQSIFICMKSETEKAFDVQEDIIHVYDAYLTGDFQLTNPAFRPEKTRKALPGGLTLEQQDAVKALVKSRVEALPKDQQAKAAITCWSSIKSKFGVTYKEVPASEFAAVLSLVARLPLDKEPLKALPFEIHFPLESAAPPAGCTGLAYYAFAQAKDWTDPGWELLLKLRTAGMNVDGPIYSHQAKIHVMTAMYNTLIGKIVESVNNGACASLPYAPVYLR